MKTKMLALLFLTAPVFAAPPRITNATVQSLPSLAQAETIGNGWIGYSITARKGFSSCGCSLSSSNNNVNSGSDDDIGPSSRTVLLFTWMVDRQADRLRFLSPACNIEGNGQTIYWVDNVSAAESIAFLKRTVDKGGDHGGDVALIAISVQAGGTDTLIDIARNNPSGRVRGKALFWLSTEAGEKAAAALREAVDNDPEEHVRSQAVFGISQLPNDQSIPILIDLLKHNRSREVRKKAAFWLGQKNDPRALAAFEEILKQ